MVNWFLNLKSINNYIDVAMLYVLFYYINNRYVISIYIFQIYKK